MESTLFLVKGEVTEEPGAEALYTTSPSPEKDKSGLPSVWPGPRPGGSWLGREGEGSLLGSVCLILLSSDFLVSSVNVQFV